MSNWKKLTVGDVCDFIGGSQPPKLEFSDVKLPDYVRLVQTRDFKTDAFITYIPKNSTNKFFGKDDIMIGRYGPPIFQIFRGMEGAYNVALLKAKPKNNIINDYLYYFLKQRKIFEYVDKLSPRTGGQTGVDLLSLNKYPIELPDLLTQQKIAAVLSALDDKIELNNRINAELEQMAKTLYDYWFVQFDFPDKSGKSYKSSGGKMVYNEVLKREIPEGWEVKKIKNIANTGSGGTPKSIEKIYYENGSIPWINSGELNNPFIVGTSNFITELGMQNSSAKLFPANTILMAMYGATAGKTSIISFEATTNQAICAVMPFEKEWLYYTKFVLNNMYQYLINLSTGSARDNLSQDKIKELDIIRPKQEILKRYSEIVSPLFNKIKNNLQQNQELSSLRDWLLPMLMNGQVRVDTLSDQVSENDNRKEDDLSMAAEPPSVYGKGTPLNIPENKKGFAKQVLAGKIVSEFKDDPAFTNIKFQKIQFLAEHIIEADLNLNYYYQAAGPYDNRFMHTIHNDFRKQKWFDCRNRRFVPLEKQEKIEGYYQGYFGPAQKKLDQLFELLYQKSEAEAEIIATLYAVWNNRIIEGSTVADKELIEDFYKWSDRKQQYTEEQILNGLQWLKTYQMEPKGFGRLIKKAKGKK
jgi:type I restriction enzyme S subunit